MFRQRSATAGRVRQAFQQTEHLEQLLGKMRFGLDPGGWRLQSAMKVVSQRCWPATLPRL